MRSLADYLVDCGMTVTGTDRSLHPAQIASFADRKIQVWPQAENRALPATVNTIIASAAIPEANPEWQAAVQQGKERFRYPEFLGQLSRKHRTCAIAGTHGKTTTSMLLAHLLNTAGAAPAFITGGRWQKSPCYGQGNNNSLLILEACEFQRHFHNLSPQSAAILNLEPDHFDCYPDTAQLQSAFDEFARRVHPDGLLLVNAADPRALAAAAHSRCRRILVSLQCEKETRIECEDASYVPIQILSESSAGTEFSISHGTVEIPSLKFPLPGKHQVMNAAFASILALEHGLNADQIRSGLQCFPGVVRRCEIRQHSSGSWFVDDYAHHPTEIRATLSALRTRFPGQELHICFQPHQIQRTNSLLNEFAEALLEADRVTILPVFAAREPEEADRCTPSLQLVESGNARGGKFEFCGSLDLCVRNLDDWIKNHPEPAAIHVTLGAGDIDRIYYELSGFTD
ncbi:MAG: hypothetical protein KDA78_08840 [Planctomycetaceae bacterium]|nr:hypothetical protein [Planctomycetaceae bacterium]